MRYPKGCIIVFARAPIPGRVKTRLAPVYGKRGAARLYQAMLSETLHKAFGLAPLELWCAPNPRHPFLHRCATRYGARVETQHGRDLGIRLLRATGQALKRYQWAIVIGSDCVSLTRSDLDIACATLTRGGSAVLGPAADGGYVLIGLRHSEPSLFHGIPWSSNRVLTLTRRRFALAGLECTELPMRWDADRPEDVRRWLKGGQKFRGVRQQQM